eukprot:TRINITY_DN8799_c0_g1_i1.p1 TRINITY_DN8799_c0_g1~~TRINITY_DN8799_c0_g1_i1.p1  ORF type:complete len:967 (-),score=169.85 TRINITY_DN8799_c0_g1_i1:2-2902(-)
MLRRLVLLLLCLYTVTGSRVREDTHRSLSFSGSSQRNALVNFGSDMGVENWLNNTGWNSQSSECSWFGVTCQNETIVKLYLPSNNLVGSLSGDIASLTGLTWIDLRNNVLYGPLPVQWSVLTNVNTIVLGVNQLSGSIPAQWSTLTNMQYFAVGVNMISGTFSSCFSTWTQIEQLFLMVNQLTGPIPDWIGALTKLQYFQLIDNNMNGSFPSTMTAMTSLLDFSVARNSFTGSIPAFFGQMTSLQTIDIAANSLTGSIPRELTSLVNLEALFVSANQLTGSFPTFLPMLPRLQTLGMYNNSLSGPIPTFVESGASPALRTLDFSANQFSGELLFDALLTICPTINTMAGANNLLTGSLPTGCPQLTQVDLSGNLFYGKLADAFGPPLLNTLLLNNNPGLHSPCNAPSPSDANLCLPSYIKLSDNKLTQGVNEPYLCSTFELTTAVAPSFATVSVGLDASYIDFKHCRCVSGYARRPNATAAADLCLLCNNSACSCENGIMRNCFPYPNATFPLMALQCPDIGYGEIACNPIGNATVYPSGATLPLNASLGGAFACADGYQGRLCSECQFGFYQSGRSCRRCASYTYWLLPLGYAVLLLVLILYLLQVPGASSGGLKITMFYFQTVLVLARAVGGGWPAAVNSAFTSTSSASSFSTTATECVFPGLDLAARYVLYYTVPLMLMAVSLLVFGLGRLQEYVRGQYLRLWRERCTYMALYFLAFVYFEICVKVFSVFGCTISDPSGALYTNSSPWVLCDSTKEPFSVLIGTSIAAFFIYVIGIPILFNVLLYRRRHSLDSLETKTALGFVFGCYRKGLFLWDTVFGIRRISLALVVSVVPFTEQTTLVINIILILQISVIIQHVFSPFGTILENRMDLLSSYVLLLSFVGAYINQNTPSGTTNNWLPTALLVLIILCGVILLAILGLTYLVMVVQKLQRFRSVFGDGAMQKMSVVGAQLQERLLSPQLAK